MCSMLRGGGELSGKVCYFYSQPAGVQDFFPTLKTFFLLPLQCRILLPHILSTQRQRRPITESDDKNWIISDLPSHVWWLVLPTGEAGGGGRECDAHFAIYLNLDMKECLYLRRWFSRPKQVFVEWTLITFASWKKRKRWLFDSLRVLVTLDSFCTNN